MITASCGPSAGMVTGATLLLDEREIPISDLPAGYTERRLNDVRWLPGRDILAVTTVAVPESA